MKFDHDSALCNHGVWLGLDGSVTDCDSDRSPRVMDRMTHLCILFKSYYKTARHLLYLAYSSSNESRLWEIWAKDIKFISHYWSVNYIHVGSSTSLKARAVGTCSGFISSYYELPLVQVNPPPPPAASTSPLPLESINVTYAVLS